MWLGGDKLTQADAEAAKMIKGHSPNPDTHPSLFFWCSIATKFTPEVMAQWPAAECPMPKGASKPKEVAAATAKKDDDIDEDELFADDGTEPVKLVA